MKYVTLTTSLAIAIVAGYFSIVGLGTIFAGAFWSIVIMATVLEIAKLVTAAYLHLEWKEISAWIRVYLVTAVFVLMFITSMGIFGYLSKAHLDHTISLGGNNEIRTEAIQRRIDRQNTVIKDSETVLAQLDGAVETLQEYDRIRGPDGSLAVRANQAEERTALNASINEAYNQIESLQEELLPLQKQQLELEAEIGPLKYIAELIYGDDAESYFDTAVRWIILLLVFVFDPLAIILLVVSTSMFKRDMIDEPDVKKKLKKKKINPLVSEKQIMVME